jgi:hypothetical protein
MLRLMPMAKPVVVFPDAVLVVADYLRSVLAGVRVETKVPDPRPTEFIRVRRIGGPRKNLFLDRPRIDIECWSGSEGDAADFMMRVRPYVLAMAGKRGTTTVYDVAEISGPMWLPDDATSHPRYAFAVDFTTRGTRLETT